METLVVILRQPTFVVLPKKEILISLTGLAAHNQQLHQEQGQVVTIPMVLSQVCYVKEFHFYYYLSLKEH